MPDFDKQSSNIHRQLRGKLSIVSKLPVQSREDLSVAYTPGVAGPCKLIAADSEEANELTIKRNSCRRERRFFSLGIGKHWRSCRDSSHGR